MSGEQKSVPASARHVDLLVSGDVLYTLNKGDPIVVVHQRLKFIPSMLLIRFGTRDRRRVVARGQFDCPKCEAERDYEVISLREWVTLFFIPILPTGNNEEREDFVECKTCKSVYDTDVLETL